MDPIFVGAIVFVATLSGGLLGNSLRTFVPEHHLEETTRATVTLGIGLVATMSALVLGLVTASAKSSFDAVDTAVKNSAAEILALDRSLARYGPETAEIRGALKDVVATRIETIWSRQPLPQALPEASANLATVEGIADAVLTLTPRDASQQWLQSRALDLCEDVFRARWLVFAGRGASVPPVFLAILLFWLTITFASFGLFAPRNATVLVTAIASALSVAGAVFLVLELDGPFDGMLRVSSEPLRYALARLNL